MFTSFRKLWNLFVAVLATYRRISALAAIGLTIVSLMWYPPVIFGAVGLALATGYAITRTTARDILNADSAAVGVQIYRRSQSSATWPLLVIATFVAFTTGLGFGRLEEGLDFSQHFARLSAHIENELKREVDPTIVERAMRRAYEMAVRDLEASQH